MHNCFYTQLATGIQNRIFHSGKLYCKGLNFGTTGEHHLRRI